MSSMSTFKKKKIAPSASYHHGNLAEALKEKALLIIKSKGFAKLNLRDLAKDCNASAAAVYRHYRNKEHLLATLAEEGLQGLQQKMIATKNPKRLQKMGLAYIQYALENPLRFRLALDGSIDKRKFSSLLKKHQQTYEIVKSEIETCVKNGLMAGDIDSLTCTAWATVHGTAMLILEHQFPNIKNQQDAKQLAMMITSIVERGLGNQK